VDRSRGWVRTAAALALVGALLASLAAGCKSEAELRKEQRAELNRLLADARSADKRTWEPAFEKLADLRGYETTAAAGFLVGQLGSSSADAMDRTAVAQRVLPRTGEVGTDQLLRSLTRVPPQSHGSLIDTLRSMGVGADAQVAAGLESDEVWRRRASVIALADLADARGLDVLVHEIVEDEWDDQWAAHAVASLGKPATDRLAQSLSGEPGRWYLAGVLSVALYLQRSGSVSPREPIDEAGTVAAVTKVLDDSSSLSFAKYLATETAAFSSMARDWLSARGYYLISIPTAPSITFGPSTPGQTFPDWAAP
jgi:hypothetical protein